MIVDQGNAAHKAAKKNDILANNSNFSPIPSLMFTHQEIQEKTLKQRNQEKLNPSSLTCNAYFFKSKSEWAIWINGKKYCKTTIHQLLDPLSAKLKESRPDKLVLVFTNPQPKQVDLIPGKTLSKRGVELH